MSITSSLTSVHCTGALTLQSVSPSRSQSTSMCGEALKLRQPLLLPSSSALQIDLFGESTLGNLHFASSDGSDDESALPSPRARRTIDDVLGLRNAEDIITMPWGELRARTQALLTDLGVPPSTYPASQPQRALFTNRTLNLRSIQVGSAGGWCCVDAHGQRVALHTCMRCSSYVRCQCMVLACCPAGARARCVHRACTPCCPLQAIGCE